MPCAITMRSCQVANAFSDARRIFCYDYWASCLSKCRTRGPFAVKRTDSTAMLRGNTSSENGDIVRHIVLHGGNNKNM